MSCVIVTGAGGLIGSEACRFFAEKGFDVVGIDNNMRAYFFGEEASTSWNVNKLKTQIKGFKHFDLDIRNESGVENLFKEFGASCYAVIHTAAQPSHDWAAKEPLTDFTVNANGTLVLLEAFRKHAPKASFIFTSTNKVYGDAPNLLPLIELDSRYEISESHAFFQNGIDESFTVDQSKHSLFGASKLAADVLVQEYGRYFNLNTVCFRGGCLTGPAHSGTELHGFLAYLVKCVVHGKPYKVFGYKGKQVRDNIHSYDLVNAFWHYSQKPKVAAVYNIGGGRHSNCSMLEAISVAEKLSGKKLDYSLLDGARSGDHIWWISDVRRFQNDFPAWKFKYGIHEIISEIVTAVKERV
jgi:CDP-paratose 2-epimerase